MKTYTVRAFWDAEARVWVAESDDVPGLITEADTLERLQAKLNVMIPELLECNGILRPEAAHDIPYRLLSELTAVAGAQWGNA